MINPTQPNIKLTTTQDYRETYANSVQVRVNVWDFFLVFGTLQQQSENEVELRNFQGIYLSPQQAKALSAILQQNLAGYESTFGEIKLDPRMMGGGPVNYVSVSHASATKAPYCSKFGFGQGSFDYGMPSLREDIPALRMTLLKELAGSRKYTRF